MKTTREKGIVIRINSYSTHQSTGPGETGVAFTKTSLEFLAEDPTNSLTLKPIIFYSHVGQEVVGKPAIYEETIETREMLISRQIRTTQKLSSQVCNNFPDYEATHVEY